MEEHPDWRPKRHVGMSVDSPNFEGLDRWAFAAAPRREAVGLRADLGAHRPLRREDPLRARRAVAQPPVPQREGRELVRALGPRPARARRRGAGDPQLGGDHRGRLVPLRARHGPSRHARSRTRRSSRSRPPSSTTSSGSRTSTGGRGRPLLERHHEERASSSWSRSSSHSAPCRRRSGRRPCSGSRTASSTRRTCIRCAATRMPWRTGRCSQARSASRAVKATPASRSSNDGSATRRG